MACATWKPLPTFGTITDDATPSESSTGDFLSEEKDGTYLPVGIVHVDPHTKAVLWPRNWSSGFGSKKDDEDYPGSPLQLEIWNVVSLDIKLEEGMPICQIIFEFVDGTLEKGYEGRFLLQGPTKPS